MHYINGQWHQGSGTAFSSYDPATGDRLWQGHSAQAQQVDAALAAARSAFPAWSMRPYTERLAIMQAFRDLLESRKGALSELISRETGKVKWDADGEAAATLGKLRFTEAAYAERTPDKQQDMGGFSATLTHRPHGVMAVFGPYNFPAHLPNGHIMPALLAGNTIIFKPSEQTPAVGEWMIRLWEEAGLPPGVINLVQGEKDTGIALAAGDIDGLLFTGSSATGEILHRQCAGRPQLLLALEMGGNNPLIIHNASDMKSAAFETILSAFTGSGQRCTCARRVIITADNPVDSYIQNLKEMADSLQVGAWNDEPQPFMGPLINMTEAERLLAAQESMLSTGAKPILKMQKRHDSQPFLSPGILDVTGTKRNDEEYFGPLLQLTRVHTLDDAIAEANATRFGLSAGLFSDNQADFDYCLPRLRAGIINFNKQTTGASGMSPFGGIGCSGNHHAAGYYAADYCAYPIASMVSERLQIPESLPPGITL